MKRAWLLLALVGCHSSSQDCSWLQWGQSAAHAGDICSSGQDLNTQMADLVYDPFVAMEAWDGYGDLYIHYQSPLVDGDDVFMELKQGTYTPCVRVPSPGVGVDCSGVYRWNSEDWAEKKLSWVGGQLVEQWVYVSDWKPSPLGGFVSPVFEPMFQPAISGPSIWVPGAGGTVYQVDKSTGFVSMQYKPDGDPIDPDTYVAGPITADADGNIYYNTIKFDHDSPLGNDQHGWLVKIDAAGNLSKVDYATLTPGAPTTCTGAFDANTTPLPWPPPNNPDGSRALPTSTFPCGTQRPAVNVAPAIGPDGTIFTVSRPAFTNRYAYVIAVHPDLTVKWKASMQGLLHDGCGVTIPDDGSATDGTKLYDCRPGADQGVDPWYNTLPDGEADDASSSSPVALPDGGVLYGSFTGYNGDRGHLLKFSAIGEFLAVYDFGWDLTPALVPGSGPNDYAMVIKDNHYGQDANGVDLGPYYITKLDQNLKPIWSFQSTNTQSCVKAPDGTTTCMSDHPHGFEWCVNAPAVDSQGTTYVNSEDGKVYAIDKDGNGLTSYFLNQSIGAAYTPLAIDHEGRIYSLNDGHLNVLGK